MFDYNLPSYYYNRKNKTGKRVYLYPNGDKLERVEVPEKLYAALKKLDEDEYNDDRSEHRHRTEFPAYYSDYDDLEDDAEYDPWWNYPDKKTFNLEDKICDRLDREAVLATLDEDDCQIYRMRIEQDRTQAETAEVLGISQSTVSRKLKEINALLERQFLTDGDNSEADIDFYVAWNELCSTSKLSNDDDLLLTYILRFIDPDDLDEFLQWFYGLKELSRFILKYIITRVEFMYDDVQKFLIKASVEDKEHFEVYYADKPPILQCVYVNLLAEYRRRVQAFSGVLVGKFSDKFDETLTKIAKRLKITEAEFIVERFLPMLTQKRMKRLEEFIKKNKIKI